MSDVSLSSSDHSLQSPTRPKLSPLNREDTPFEQPLEQQEAPTLAGKSDAMNTLRGRIERFAQSDLPVLILGETGTGKSLCARVLHQCSQRAEAPFVSVNCAALPAEAIMAELFGLSAPRVQRSPKRVTSSKHPRHTHKPLTLTRQAQQGTLCLDEVGELPLEAQSALLRALEREPSKGEAPRFRLVCATQHSLPELIRQGRFRADLYHRLSALTLEVPPLRLRLVDVSLLAFELNRAVSARVSRSAWRVMQEHAWPGNVRELQQLLARLELEHPKGLIKPPQLSLLSPPPAPAIALPHEGSFLPSALFAAHAQVDSATWLDELTLKELITRHVLRAVERHRGVTGAARALEVSRNTIYRYLDLAFESFDEANARHEEDTSPPQAVACEYEPESDERVA